MNRMHPSIGENMGAGDSHNRRLGIGLAVLIVLYVIAVAAFIVLY